MIAVVCNYARIFLVVSFAATALAQDQAWGSADPILKDFAGRKFEFLGTPGSYYNLYSDQAHQVNMGLIPGFVDGHNGTYMNEFGLAFHHLRSQVSLISEDGDILVQSWTQGRGGQQVGKRDMLTSNSAAVHTVGKFQGDSLTVSSEPFRFWTGRTVDILTGTLKLSIWAVPAGEVDTMGMSQPAYLNFNLSLLAPPAGDLAEGIIGESLHTVLKEAKTKSSNLTTGVMAENMPFEDNKAIAGFEGKGTSESYAVSTVFGSDFMYNQFGLALDPSSVARRAMQTSPYLILSFPIASGGSIRA